VRVLWTVPNNTTALQGALCGLVRVNQEIIKRKKFKPLYKSGVRYVREERMAGEPERWLNIEELHAKRKGDCEEITAARVAELRALGIDAQPYVKRTGPKKFHALVLMPSGKFEDPSRKLGM
jgi:hypothetical protein